MVCWRAKPLMASQSPRRMEAVIESPGERTSCRTFPRPTTGSSHDDDVRGGTRGRRRRRWRAGTGTSSSYSHSSSDSVISAVIVLLVCLLAATGCASQESDKQAVEQEIERLLNADAATHNCFAFVPGPSWSVVLPYESSRASLGLDISKSGQSTLDCLESQKASSLVSTTSLLYQLTLHRDGWEDEGRAQVEASPLQLLSSMQLTHEDLFRYLILRGNYSVRFDLCQREAAASADVSADTQAAPESLWSLTASAPGCETLPEEESVVSDEVASVTKARVNEACLMEKQDRNVSGASWSSTIHVDPSGITFSFMFEPCTTAEGTNGSVSSLPYDRARVTLYSSTAIDNNPCGETDSSLTESDTWEPISHAGDEAGVVKLLHQRTQVEGDRYYCLVASMEDHILCADNNASLPHICRMHSDWVFVPLIPTIARYIPFCTSHFRCGWLYLTVVCSFALLVSCCLALCCVYCRCCCRSFRGKKHRVNLRRDEPGAQFDGLCLGDTNTLVPKKTWVELHSEWDTEPPKNPGKILLLYSPDSSLFRDLQASLKSFLEMACHCVVLDLFDEELFESIAFDPELWLSNLLQDPDFKIVVICSEGAYKRQQALLSKEVLNIPDNATMDGLFSAGLKFIQDNHAYDYNRLALARYEMLSLTAPEYRLQEMVPNREFLVPTQLHELFCWIHSYDPLDLLGKPWDRYHLEWQLLTDALKQTRMDRK